jgi:hypothetical protein
MNYLERVRAIQQGWAEKQGVDTDDTGAKSVLGAKSLALVCSCPAPIGTAGRGPGYSVCVVCGHTWRCKECGGCRQCGPPSRKVRTEDGGLPLPMGFAGLDKEEITRIERINMNLGVTDPLASKLSVISWLYQHHRDLGNLEIANRLKQAYWQLREPDPDLVALSKMTEADRETFLCRLCNGQAWLTREYEAKMVDKSEIMTDGHFQKALDTWAQWETHLRVKHAYTGCIHGEDQRCPEEAVVNCNACLEGAD